MASTPPAPISLSPPPTLPQAPPIPLPEQFIFTDELTDAETDSVVSPPNSCTIFQNSLKTPRDSEVHFYKHSRNNNKFTPKNFVYTRLHPNEQKMIEIQELKVLGIPRTFFNIIKDILETEFEKEITI